MKRGLERLHGKNKRMNGRKKRKIFCRSKGQDCFKYVKWNIEIVNVIMIYNKKGYMIFNAS